MTANGKKPYLYRTAYMAKFSDPGFTATQLKRMNMGGCDAVVFVSIMRGNDKLEPYEGSKSFVVGSCDGREGQEIPMGEYFQAMSQIATHILDSIGAHEALEPLRKACKDVVDSHRRLIGLRQQPDGTWVRDQ